MIKDKKDKRFYVALTYAQGIALIDVLAALGVPSSLWNAAATIFATSLQRALKESLTKDGHGTEN